MASFHMWGTILEIVDIHPDNSEPDLPPEPDPPLVVDPPVVLDPVPEPDPPLEPDPLLLQYYIAGWQFGERVTPAPMVARTVPETWLYQGEESLGNRSVVLSLPAQVPVDAVSADDLPPESESDRALRFDAALGDWDSDTTPPLEVELEPGLPDLFFEMDPTESAAQLL